MLDEYIDKQKIVYKTLVNSVKNNKYSHAYLFESNGNKDVYDLAISFAKCLLCPKNYSNYKACKDCKQCERIDKKCFTDLKIIEADGLWIKKEQLDELQKEFSTKSLESNKKVYIINNAEKLNVQTSNSLLKFLEEPEENIIAILITDNIYQLLDTIISRCQIISFSKQKELLSPIEIIESSLNISSIDKNIEEKINIVNDFIYYLEKHKVDTILLTQKLWHNYFKERTDFILGFELLILYYKDLINLKIDRKVEIYLSYINYMEEIIKNNNLNELIYKMNIIMKLKDYLKINANQNLLMDKLIIEITGGLVNE